MKIREWLARYSLLPITSPPPPPVIYHGDVHDFDDDNLSALLAENGAIITNQSFRLRRDVVVPSGVAVIGCIFTCHGQVAFAVREGAEFACNVIKGRDLFLSIQ